MNIHRAALLVATTIITASCSEKSPQDGDKDAITSGTPREVARAEGKTTGGGGEPHPRERKIAEDCVALLRSTKVVSSQAANTDCPGCPAGGAEVLTLRQMKTDAVSCSGDTCAVVVTIRAIFNPGLGDKIAGGLTAWIPPEQRSAYLSGQMPAGEQVYRVQITYHLRDEAWTAVEFDRAPLE
ncbi:MAG: hypothetical protein ABIR71_08575 [Chthoniobacterales bacterium]